MSAQHQLNGAASLFALYSPCNATELFSSVQFISVQFISSALIEHVFSEVESLDS